MKVSLSELPYMDCNVFDLTALHISSREIVYNYIKHGRFKNLIHYCTEGRRRYYDADNNYLFSIKKNDILFISDKTKYLSEILPEDGLTSGIGLCFNVFDSNGKPVEITDSFKILASDENDFYLKKINNIYLSVLRHKNITLKTKSLFFDLLTRLLAPDQETKEFLELQPAITFLETHPEANVSIADLAQKCCMSISNFSHKFTKYSGGVSPLKYRNRIRLMKAEELTSDSNCSIETIAEQLGFYDASYLCKYYKKNTGHTLKRNIKK